MPSPRRDDEIIDILETRVLPWWELHGLSHFAASKATLHEFNKQRLPEDIRTYVQKRRGKKVAAHGPRYFDNTSYAVASWPEDEQWSIRYPSLVCVLKGSADFHIADYVVQCPQSHFFLFTPLVPYPNGKRSHLEGSDIENRYCELLWFMTPPGATNRISCWTCHSQGSQHWMHQLFDYCLIGQSEVISFFNLFMQEMLEKPEGYREMADISFRGFLRLFLRDLKAGQFSTAGKNTSYESPQDSSPIEMAKIYISSHINQSLTLESVSRAVFMSRTTFSQRFVQETGKTFHQYLTECRLTEAKRLLSEGSWSVTSTSRVVGLSTAQLYNLFLKHEGCTPSEYSNQHKPPAAI